MEPSRKERAKERNTGAIAQLCRHLAGLLGRL
jgi:hypothetical protein